MSSSIHPQNNGSSTNGVSPPPSSSVETNTNHTSEYISDKLVHADGVSQEYFITQKEVDQFSASPVVKSRTAHAFGKMDAAFSSISSHFRKFINHLQELKKDFLVTWQQVKRQLHPLPNRLSHAEEIELEDSRNTDYAAIQTTGAIEEESPYSSMPDHPKEEADASVPPEPTHYHSTPVEQPKNLIRQRTVSSGKFDLMPNPLRVNRAQTTPSKPDPSILKVQTYLDLTTTEGQTIGNMVHQAKGGNSSAINEKMLKINQYIKDHAASIFASIKHEGDVKEISQEGETLYFSADTRVGYVYLKVAELKGGFNKSGIEKIVRVADTAFEKLEHLEVKVQQTLGLVSSSNQEIATCLAIEEKRKEDPAAVSRLLQTHQVTHIDSQKGLKVGITAEYCEGGDVNKLISSHHHLSLSESCELAAQMCEALDQLHQLKRVHRDLNPSNFFIKNGEVKLGDFGTTYAEGELNRKANLEYLDHCPIAWLDSFILNQQRSHLQNNPLITHHAMDRAGLGLTLLQLFTKTSRSDLNSQINGEVSQETKALLFKEELQNLKIELQAHTMRTQLLKSLNASSRQLLNDLIGQKNNVYNLDDAALNQLLNQLERSRVIDPLSLKEDSSTVRDQKNRIVQNFVLKMRQLESLKNQGAEFVQKLEQTNLETAQFESLDELMAIGEKLAKDNQLNVFSKTRSLMIKTVWKENILDSSLYQYIDNLYPTLSQTMKELLRPSRDTEDFLREMNLKQIATLFRQIGEEYRSGHHIFTALHHPVTPPPTPTEGPYETVTG